MLRTAICDLFGIKHPIIQGGMAHIGTAELVSAVSNAGALGIIGCGFYQPHWVKEQIRLTKQKTTAPFGINVPLNSPYAEEVIEVILQEGVSIIATGAGNPEPYIPRFKKAGMTWIHKCVGVRYALKVEKMGADVVTVVGYENGGATGKLDIGTLVLVPTVVDAVNLPVVGGGGIADGRGLLAVLALGAEGVIIGTRIMMTRECPIHDNLKNALIKASELDTML